MGQVELDHLGHRPGQKLPVMADQYGGRGQSGHEVLQPLEPDQIEIVGGLVEQEDVVATQQQRGHCGAGSLTTRQGEHRLIQVHGQAEARRHALGPLGEISRTQRQPSFEGIVVPVVRAGPAQAERLGGRIEFPLRLGHPGPPSNEVTHRLIRTATSSDVAVLPNATSSDVAVLPNATSSDVAVLPNATSSDVAVLLRQVADRGRGRAEQDAALLGRLDAGEDPQQGRLAGSVGADQADHIPRRHSQIQAAEEHPVAVSGGQVLHDQGGSHPINSASSPKRPSGKEQVSRLSLPTLP